MRYLITAVVMFGFVQALGEEADQAKNEHDCVIELEFDSEGNFPEGLAVVDLDEKRGCIYHKAEELTAGELAFEPANGLLTILGAFAGLFEQNK